MDTEQTNETATKQPANRQYVFAMRCTNDFGHFEPGDRARGAFPADLVEAYLAAGILKEQTRV